MSTKPFRFRTDLIVSQQVHDDESIYIIKDSVTGRFFRLREPEYRITQQLDGLTSLDLVHQRVEEQIGARLALPTLEQFIDTLRRLGLLEEEEAKEGHLPPRLGRVEGGLLSLRLKVFDPDQLLDCLVQKARFFFTPSFLTVSVAFILFAISVTVVNWGEISRDLVRLYRWEGLLAAWLVIFLVGAIHEFAHGLACKRFGGEVHEVGFLLIYFQPAFYCNVSDAWLFSEKAKRLWVTFAGAYCEIFLWALATLTWRVTEPGTWLNFATLVVMATSGIRTLFNLNPLIKLDGYYLLSDALEIPNLRRRAFSYLSAQFKQMRGSAVQGVTEVTPSERRTYLVYGLLAGTYSISLLGFIALQLGSFLIGRYQGLGLILFTGLLLAVFRNPLKRVFPQLADLFRSGQGVFAPMNRLKKVLVLSAAVIAILFLGRMELRVSGEFKVLPAQNADVRAEVEGLIEQIPVEEGSVVSAGDLIARLSDRDYRAELRKTEAEMAEKQAKLKGLEAGPRREEIALASGTIETATTKQDYARRQYKETKQMQAERLAKTNASVQKAEERLKYAKHYLDVFLSLWNDKAISRKQIEEAEEGVAVREQELEEARAERMQVLADDLADARKAVAVAEKEQGEAKGKLKLLLAGSRPEDIEATKAEIARLAAQRDYLEDQLRLVRVVSPISGMVTTAKLKEKIGQHVKKGDLIAQVHELKTVRAEIPISEKEIADVKVGQRVVLKARAYPEIRFAGTVTAIAPTATKDEEGRGGRLILVSTQIDNPSLLLKPEMTGHAKIVCGKRWIIDLVTRRLARYIRVEFWSWW